MKALYEFIVKVDDVYNNTIKVGGKEFKVDKDFQLGKYVNRIGVIQYVPIKLKTELKVGDTILFDKNITLTSNFGEGKETDSVFLVDKKQGLFRIPENLIYMRKNIKDWECLSPFVFVEPIKNEIVNTNGLFINESKDYKGNKDQCGVIAFLNSDLKSKGFKVGDSIVFREDSEYEFYLDDKTYYKMENEDVIAILN